MVRGFFIENHPIIQVALGWDRSVQTPHMILDTGFTGDLQVTPKIAKELGLQVSSVTPAQIASGQTVQIPTALAIASMEGETSFVQVLIAESMPLAGISFLAKFDYKATVDCKFRTVMLERVTAA
ncbi:MAG: hypothetical protein COU11_01755 [Candidatus Harrisonbacteria bacterium CG10_big_fil_rev_8_21_14_0_10_49_15]|uniref:Clan AA aspartic protease n=1 Tax=Candidatus Harrisonbacteria bacterium CG10_big_fil_rev_8_21_14_0_10_49_15 TaxID=1974587 RepID=A0A2H0ULA3_9BACT|nr:MAG: hypothetical protein COU11_01755 [Candidatus Harrisonbacteria bacterium CG10_big_fil_rev_8_21_14_0_10_49_15]